MTGINEKYNCLKEHYQCYKTKKQSLIHTDKKSYN